MSLFEWLWERPSPDDYGSVEIHDNSDAGLVRPVERIIGFIVAMTVWLGILIAATVIQKTWSNFYFFLIALGSSFVYILLGYILSPNPDTDNLGWGGFMFDNPFAISDDINRSLLWLKILLMPGRLLGLGIFGIFRLMR